MNPDQTPQPGSEITPGGQVVPPAPAQPTPQAQVVVQPAGVPPTPAPEVTAAQSQATPMAAAQPQVPPEAITQTQPPPANSGVGAFVAAEASQALQSQTDIPKSYGKFSQIKGMIFAVVLLIAANIMGAVVYQKSHKTIILVLVNGIFSLVGLLVFIMSFISYRQLTKAQKNPPAFTQFQSDTAVDYKIPLAAAAVAPDESVVNWFGPVTRSDWSKSNINFTVLSHEVDKNAENTLLITNKQIIAVMFGPADIEGIDVSAMRGLASMGLQAAPEDEMAKGIQFRTLYASKWQEIVTKFTSQPLATSLTNHLNFGIPYNQLASVEAKKTFANPGIILHFNNGSKFTYATFKKDRIDEVVNTLGQYVRVQ